MFQGVLNQGKRAGVLPDTLPDHVTPFTCPTIDMLNKLYLLFTWLPGDQSPVSEHCNKCIFNSIMAARHVIGAIGVSMTYRSTWPPRGWNRGRFHLTACTTAAAQVITRRQVGIDQRCWSLGYCWVGGTKLSAPRGVNIHQSPASVHLIRFQIGGR